MTLDRRNLLKLSALAAGMLASGMALAAADLGDTLNRALATALPTDKLEVIVSFDQTGPLQPSQIEGLKSLGLTPGRSMRALPMAGVMATPLQIAGIAGRSDVRSIRLNRDLTYYNRDARRISGVDAVQADPDLGYTGQGVTVMVNDSGIDATHEDLKFGDKVVQNVQALGNAHALADFLPVTLAGARRGKKPA